MNYDGLARAIRRCPLGNDFRLLPKREAGPHEVRGALDHSRCSGHHQDGGDLGIRHHGLRFRHTGNRLLIEVHLLFPYEEPVGHAHSLATILEERLVATLSYPSEILTHLESLEDHEEVHLRKRESGRLA